MPKRSATKKNSSGKNRRAYNTIQLLNFAPDSYLERTSRPIYAIFFLLPFIVFYEVGTILINTDVLNQSQVRVVAFVWLQNLLEYIGAGERLAWIAPPLVVVIILAGLQMTSHTEWRFAAVDVLPMTLECVLLAVPLIVLCLFLSGFAGQQPQTDAQSQALVVPPAHTSQWPLGRFDASGVWPAARVAVTSSGRSLLANIVTAIGAGIYEELVFRLILICLLMMLFQDLLRLSHKSSIVLSVLISAALFSAHHHVVILDGQIGQTGRFDSVQFAFRTLAGVYFAGLFAFRGFAITAGTHAYYDVIGTIVNAVFF